MKNLHNIRGTIPPEVLAWCWGHIHFSYRYIRETDTLFFLKYGLSPGDLRPKEQLLRWIKENTRSNINQDRIPHNLEIV